MEPEIRVGAYGLPHTSAMSSGGHVILEPQPPLLPPAFVDGFHEAHYGLFFKLFRTPFVMACAHAIRRNQLGVG